LAPNQRGRRGSEPANKPEIDRGRGPSGVRIFIVPHHRWEPGDYTHWKHATPRQLAGAENQIFAKGTWGGEWHPDFVPQEGDIIIKEHWAQSGFANTDLDQQLKQHGIEKIILIGMLANTCIESTGRFGMELGYHVTLVKDATAAESWEAMHAAELNGPTFAHAILTTQELLGRTDLQRPARVYADIATH
jgi:nicotinamidase-related amidase